MSHSKVIIEVDGIVAETIPCEDVNITFDGDSIIVKVSSADGAGVDSDAPTPDGFSIPETSENLQLTGEDLESFDLLSEFRIPENRTKKIKDVESDAVTVESESYNIQDLASIQNASLDLIERERKFLDDGYLVISSEVPKYVYENFNYFKLIETAVLYKAEKATATSVED